MTYTGENSMVIGLNAALDEYNREWPVDENGEEVPGCPFGSGPCTGCGRCEYDGSQ